MGSIIGGVFGKDVAGGLTGSTAADAAKSAARTQAQSQREALDYLKQKEKLPEQLRGESLTQLAGLYGLEGGDSGALQALQQSPMYQSVMSGQDAGEDAILRHASATGGLRSGDVQGALAQYAPALQQQALQSSMQGLQGMAQLPSNANNIAGLTAGIGQTQAQGITAAAQARQQGLSNMAGMGMQAAMMFSDARLKLDVKPAGKRHGIKWYSWRWSDEAKSLGLEGSGEGFMAHDVHAVMPEAVTTNGDYLMVNYEMVAANA